MHTFPKGQINAAAASIGIGIAVVGLIAYAMLLFSATQSIAQRDQPAIAAAR